MAGRQRRQFGPLGQVRRIVSKGRDVDRGQADQVPSDMVRADLVAAIGRERHPVREEQDLAHQPSPRAICGPIRLAIGNGRRFHSAIRAACLALVGSASRASAPGAVHCA